MNPPKTAFTGLATQRSKLLAELDKQLLAHRRTYVCMLGAEMRLDAAKARLDATDEDATTTTARQSLKNLRFSNARYLDRALELMTEAQRLGIGDTAKEEIRTSAAMNERALKAFRSGEGLPDESTAQLEGDDA